MSIIAFAQERRVDRRVAESACGGDDKSHLGLTMIGRPLISRRFRRIGQLLLAGVCAMVFAHPAQAQTYYDWTSSAGGGPYATGTDLCTAFVSYVNSGGYLAVFSLISANPPGPPTAGGQRALCNTLVMNMQPGGYFGSTYLQTFPPGYAEVVSGPQHFVSSTPLAHTQTSTCNCAGDPINPAVGNVFTTEEDVKFAGAGTIAFRRFYNSADVTGVDGVIGWRHSYGRSVATIYLNLAPTYPGSSSSVSPTYSTEAAACTSGFTAIQSSVSA